MTLKEILLATVPTIFVGLLIFLAQKRSGERDRASDRALIGSLKSQVAESRTRIAELEGELKAALEENAVLTLGPAIDRDGVYIYPKGSPEHKASLKIRHMERVRLVTSLEPDKSKWRSLVEDLEKPLTKEETLALLDSMEEQPDQELKRIARELRGKLSGKIHP